MRIAFAVLLSLVLLPLHAAEPAPVELSPLVMRALEAPVPVAGGDGRLHMAWELTLANLTGEPVKVESLAVVDAANGDTLRRYDAAEVAKRLVVRDRAAKPGVLGPSQTGIVYLHAEVPDGRTLPRTRVHRLTASMSDGRTITVDAAEVRPTAPSDLVLDPPLRGEGYIAGDGCCESTRHLRASLPIAGGIHTAQRFAIDWEQLDDQGRIVHGDPKNLANYTIYGQPALAVADARVVTARDGLPDSPPGQLPRGIALADADGNHVVLDLGGGRYALYAHLQPGSVRVRAGDAVQRGQVLGLVGSSGNSSEPHLHFHVMDGPSPFISNGLPYRLREFTARSRGTSTAAFDQAIVDGKPMPLEPLAGDAVRRDVMPLDLWIVDF